MMQHGVCWELPTLERLTNGIVYGLSGSTEPLGETPRERCKYLFPTPTCCQAPNSTSHTKGPKSLQEVARTNWSPGQKWLTPTATEGLRCAFSQEASAKHWEKHPRSNLSEQLASRDLKNGVTWSAGGRLNPDWTEWLMGWPIGWSDSKPLGMDKFRWWLQLHFAC
jgi:hypothetical protein